MCVTQYGRRSVVTGGLKGFSRICSDVGVEPKSSDGIFEVLCCEAIGGVSANGLLERSKGTGSNGSHNRACLSSKVYGLSLKEMRVDG